MSIWIHGPWRHWLAELVVWRDHGGRHVHGALWWGWIGCDGTAANGDGGCCATVPHQIDCPRGIFMPKVDHEDEEGAVDVVEVDFLSGF